MPGSGVRVSPQLQKEVQDNPTASTSGAVFLSSDCIAQNEEGCSPPKSAFANCGRARSNFSRLLSEQLGRKTLTLGEPLHLERGRIDCLLELPESVADLL